jgi:ParB-like chromosome segregation protein Spo0J
MKIEYWNIEKVKPYPGNPRRNDRAVEAVAKSIQEFGFRQPIVVDSAGVIICGHTRYKAALKLGLKTVPVHVAADLTPQQARAYRIADNRAAENSEWDVDLLPIELGELRDGGTDLKLLGFTDKELAEYLREFDTDLEGGEADAEEAAETVHCPKCGHEFPLS